MPLPGHWDFLVSQEPHQSVMEVPLEPPSIVNPVLLFLPFFPPHGGEESSHEVTEFSHLLDRQEDGKGEFASHVSNPHIKLLWKQETDNVSGKLCAS